MSCVNKVQSLEKELKAANEHIKFLSSLTGQPGPKLNNLFGDDKPSLFEQEVRVADKVPGSVSGEDSNFEQMQPQLDIRQQKSTPITDPTQFEQDSYPQDHHSDTHEQQNKTSTAVATKKTTKKKGAKGQVSNYGKNS
jgi:hypothetical protein